MSTRWSKWYRNVPLGCGLRLSWHVYLEAVDNQLYLEVECYHANARRNKTLWRVNRRYPSWATRLRVCRLGKSSPTPEKPDAWD